MKIRYSEFSNDGFLFYTEYWCKLTINNNSIYDIFITIFTKCITSQKKSKTVFFLLQIFETISILLSQQKKKNLFSSSKKRLVGRKCSLAILIYGMSKNVLA